MIISLDEIINKILARLFVGVNSIIPHANTGTHRASPSPENIEMIGQHLPTLKKPGPMKFANWLFVESANQFYVCPTKI